MTNTTYRPYIPWPSDLADDMVVRSPAHRRAPVPSRVTFEPSRLPTPILALDVDGPLNPFRMAPKARRRGGFSSVPWRERVSYRAGSAWVPYSSLDLSREMGARLAEFSRVHDVELVWCTLWEHNANAIVGPALGLPRLPWVDFHSHASRAWKWDAVAEFAAGRPLAWLDDSFTHKAVARAASGFDKARRNLPTLCHEVSPAHGIRFADLEAVASWLVTARLAW